MVTPLAQAGVREVCGPAEDAEWICELVFELTSNEPLARIAGAGATVVWLAVIVVAALAASALSRRAVERYSRRLEERTVQRLERDLERGAITDTQRFRTRRLQRLQAASGVVKGVIGVVIWLTALFLVLDLFGVPLQPLLAGAGVVSVVIGFGAQQLVRDVLAGIAMLIEDQYGVGDWIEVDGVFGEVERVGLRSTAYRDVDGILHHVLNGYMQRVGNLSQRWARTTLDVPVALDADLPAAKALVFKVATDLAQDPVYGQDVIGPPEVWGVQEFGPEGVRIRVVIPTKPLRNWDLARQLRERLKLAFDAAGIRMPGQLVDLGGQGAGYPVLTSRREPTSGAGAHRRHLDPEVLWSEEPGSTDDAAAASAAQLDDGDTAAADITGPMAGHVAPAADITGPMARHAAPATNTDDTDPDGTDTGGTDDPDGADPDPAHDGADPRYSGADASDDEPSDATLELRLRQGPRPRPD